MNAWYEQLARSLEEIGNGMQRLTQQYGDGAGESAAVEGKIRQSMAEVQGEIQRLKGMLQEAAAKTSDGVPAEWDLVAVVPADQADPEKAEQSGMLPDAATLGDAFVRGMDGFERLQELIKRHSQRPLDERQVWAEEVERLGKEFHRIYQLARDAHDANWHDRYY